MREAAPMSIVPFEPDKSKNPQSKTKETVFFSRIEFDAILRLYGRKVALGEWRDYGLEQFDDGVAFCIFRRSSEAALYRIEKRPLLARKQGAFCVRNQAGLILKRGHDLGVVMGVLDRDRLSSL